MFFSSVLFRAERDKDGEVEEQMTDGAKGGNKRWTARGQTDGEVDVKEGKREKWRHGERWRDVADRLIFTIR